MCQHKTFKFYYKIRMWAKKMKGMRVSFPSTDNLMIRLQQVGTGPPLYR